MLNAVNRKLHSLLTHPERQDAGALSNFVTYSRRLKDKLVNFAVLDAAELVVEKKELEPDLPES